MFSKLKQFKDLRNQAKELQAKLAVEKVSVDSNWGKLKLTLNGNMEIENLTIDPSLINPEKKETLEKDLAKLFNDGIKKAQKLMAQKMYKDGGFSGLSDLLKK